MPMGDSTQTNPPAAAAGKTISQVFAAEQAARIVETFSARGSTYGPPEVNFANIAAFWAAWVKARHGVAVAFDAVDVANMSALIKVARLAATPEHQDSGLDAAVYMLLGVGCAIDGSILRAALDAAEDIGELAGERSATAQDVFPPSTAQENDGASEAAPSVPTRVVTGAHKAVRIVDDADLTIPTHLLRGHPDCVVKS